MSFMRCYKPLMHLKGSQLNFYLLRQPEHMMRLRSSCQVRTQNTQLIRPRQPIPPRSPATIRKVQHCPLCQVFAHIFFLLAVQRHLWRWQPEPEDSVRSFGHEACSGPLLRPGVTTTHLAAVQDRTLSLHVDHWRMVTGRKGISTDRKQNILLDVKRNTAQT